MNAIFLRTALASLLLLGAGTPVAHAASCQFVLGFAQMAAAIPQVGACTENEHTDGAFTIQATTRGVLAYAAAANSTYFISGDLVWIRSIAPVDAIYVRTFPERLSWEPDYGSTDTIKASRVVCPEPGVCWTEAAIVASAGSPTPTALCRDGTFSYAVTHQGDCSSHGGVGAFYR